MVPAARVVQDGELSPLVAAELEEWIDRRIERKKGGRGVRGTKELEFWGEQG